MEFFIFAGVVVGFFWSLSTLRELQQGQIEVLQPLKRIEDALQTGSHIVESADDR